MCPENCAKKTGRAMDRADRRILDIIQTEFPLVSRPYAAIGEQVGLTEAEVLARVRTMQGLGIIRRIGANFQSRKLGWKSTLCAAAVPEHMLQEFVEVVNSYPGVTHNYLRQHEYNVWFTLIRPSWEDIERELQEISSKTGLEVLNLPAEKMFKIRVDFPMQDAEQDQE